MGTKNSCKTAAVMGLLGRGPAAEPAPLEEGHTTDLTRTPEIIYAEINFYSGTMLFSAIEIGRRMVELKEKLPHGSFIDEIKKNTTWSRSQINNFMRLFREYGNSNVQAIGHLSPTKALALLALPESEREEFLGETHEINGEEKTVIDMTSRELDKAIKERDEALKAAALAQAEQSAAEQARKKIAEDMALANERIAELNAEVEAKSSWASLAQDAAEQLKKELEELRSRPVEVAVEADPAAIEAARKEAEAAMQDKLNQAKKAQAEAEKAQKAAEDAQAKAQQEMERTRAEAQAIREQAEKAEKRASIDTDADMVLFRELYDQTQTMVKRMGGVRLKKQDKEPEKAGGLHNALLALIPVVKEAAGQ